MPRPAQKASLAKDSTANLGFETATRFPANGSMLSNQSGDCPALSALIATKAKPQSQTRQRDIRRALIEADLADTAVRDSALLQSKATSQVLSKAKNNMVAFSGQLFYSTQITVCLRFCWKNNPLNRANDARLFDGETELRLVA